MSSYYMPENLIYDRSDFETGAWWPLQRREEGIDSPYRALYETNLIHPDLKAGNIVAPSGQYFASVAHALFQLGQTLNPEELRLSDVIAEIRSEWYGAAVPAIELATCLSWTSLQYIASWPIGAVDIWTPFRFTSTVLARLGHWEPDSLAHEWILEFYYGEQKLISRALKAENERCFFRAAAALVLRSLKLIHQAARAFCGIAWSRRLSHLLHGSHPPKSEGMASRQAFGCA